MTRDYNHTRGMGPAPVISTPSTDPPSEASRRSQPIGWWPRAPEPEPRKLRYPIADFTPGEGRQFIRQMELLAGLYRGRWHWQKGWV